MTGEADTSGSRGRADAAAHWDAVHAARPEEAASWYQRWPVVSLRMLAALGSTIDDAIVDVGGGTGGFARVLVDRGYRDVTVVEVSSAALVLARERCRGAPQVALVQSDVLDWRPSRRYDLWHDRAVLHFLTSQKQRERYRRALRHALAPEGGVIIGVFAHASPPSCSGLPVARYNAAELLAAIGDGFTLIGEAHEQHRTPSGAIQPFTWLALRRSG